MPIDISLNDLVIAYRKAKVDVFYENGDPIIMSFVEYERNLFSNLSKLRDEILTNELGFIAEMEVTPPFHWTIKDSSVKSKSFVYFSNGRRHWEELNNHEIHFRIVGSLPVEFHILSSLWIDKVGHKFEVKLSENVYGSRLKRSNQPPNGDFMDSYDINLPHPKHSSHFRPYIWDYKKWQDNGVRSIKSALENDKDVIAITADLKKFYHNIDPTFITNEKYWIDIGIASLDETENYINNILHKALIKWNEIVFDKIPNLHKDNLEHIGIPIGLAASKVIANILLIQIDRDIEQQLNPVFYGRYVDDIFLVLNDTKTITNADQFWEYVSKRIAAFTIENEEVKYKHELSEKSCIKFGKQKEKLFILEGSSGETFINAIDDALNKSSSEWRMLPDSDDDFENAAKQIINPSTDSTEMVNSIRKSDGVSIQRLKFSLFLRNIEELVLNLPSSMWDKNLESFAELCKDFIFNPENIGIYSKYHYRIFRVLIYSGKEKAVKDVWKTIGISLTLLKSRFDEQHALELESFANLLKQVFKQAFYTSINLFSLNLKKSDSIKKIFHTIFEEELVIDRCIAAFICDMHLLPLKTVFFEGINIYESLNANQGDAIASKKENHFEDFYHKSHSTIERENNIITDKEIECNWFWHEYYAKINNHGFPLSLVLYTRRLTILEITQLISQWCSTQVYEFERVLKIFDYASIVPNHIQTYRDNKPVSYGGMEESNAPWLVTLDNEHIKNPTFALTSYEVKSKSWVASVNRTYEPDVTRIKRLFSLINSILHCRTNIDYVVLPELSVPRKIINLICKRLKTKNISLISGVEYKFHTDSNKTIVVNQLAYTLCKKIAGVRQQLQILQDKTLPAIHEQRDLYNIAGLLYRPTNHAKYIINHNGFFFSGLICNDLLNIDNRCVLRGKIDALIVVEWNKDIDTYNALVESTANDLHSFVVQVNNREYGDTRLRAPYKTDYKRDLARVKGGELDFFVVSTIEALELRTFQKHHVSPPEPFKPVPTGFKISEARRNIDNNPRNYS